MPNGVKYSTTTPSGSLRKSNVVLGVTGDLGPTANTGFYSMPTPSSGKYIINKVAASGVPLFFAPQNDTELIQLARNEGATGADTGSAAAVLSWIATQPNLEAANFQYENIVTDGLVLNLDAGFVGSYPTINTTWYDLSGNNNSGSLTNGPTFNSANSGSIVFDGVDDYVNCGNLSTLNNMTIQMFVKVLSNAGGYKAFGGAVGASGNDYDSGFNIDMQSGTTTAFTNCSIEGGFLRVGGGTNFMTSSVTFGTWCNICFTISPTFIQFYLNGVAQYGTNRLNNASSTIGMNNLVIGARPFILPNTSINANIANTQIYNRALTSTEVLQNYNAQKSRFGL
jgi:hypothetical protein